jgi:hypothetical protein
MKKTKELKYWNGRGLGSFNRWHINICAYTKKQAAELLDTIYNFASYYEISNYYSDCWGNDMKEIKPTEPSIYAVNKNGVVFEINTPEQIKFALENKDLKK